MRNSSRERESRQALRNLVGLFHFGKHGTGGVKKQGLVMAVFFKNRWLCIRATVLILAFAFSISARAAQSGMAQGSREITDETGRLVKIPAQVRRIVSLAPSLTETVYALGLQDRL